MTAIDLPQAGKTRFHAEAALLPLLIESLDIPKRKGRGPTRLMSPVKTFKNCGSSSRLSFLKTTADPCHTGIVAHFKGGAENFVFRF